MQMFILLLPPFSIMFQDLRGLMLLRRPAKSVAKERELRWRPPYRPTGSAELLGRSDPGAPMDSRSRMPTVVPAQLGGQTS
jgi:hypothetical protein